MDLDNIIRRCETHLDGRSEPDKHYFFDAVYNLAFSERERQSTQSRPLPNAANEVEALASEARAMLADLKRGWLWVLLTRQPPRKP